MIKSLNWAIDPAARVVRFTLTQDIALTPITFALSFDVLQPIVGQTLVSDGELRQKLARKPRIVPG